MHHFAAYVTHHRVYTIATLAVLILCLWGARSILRAFRPITDERPPTRAHEVTDRLLGWRWPRRRRLTEPEAVAVLRARHHRPALALPATPAPEPEDVEHAGADHDWANTLRRIKDQPGVLNRAALEEPTQTFLAVVPTDEEVEVARWGAYWRSADNRLEKVRRAGDADHAKFYPEYPAIRRAIDLRDAELHSKAVQKAERVVTGEYRTIRPAPAARETPAQRRRRVKREHRAAGATT